MAVAEESPSLVAQVLAGGSRDLKVLAARGLLPLPPEELLPLLVKLAGDPDPEIAGRARAAFKATDPRLLADYLSREAGPAELEFCAGEVEHPQILEALLRRRDVPRKLLIQLAPQLDPTLQEVLIWRQDAIVEEPAILSALATNPRLERSVARRIGEYREHLLPREELVGVEEVVADEEEQEATDEEVELELARVAELPPEGDKDEATGLSEGQIRALPIPVRLKLSRGASRTLRGILIRDTNPRVAVSVTQNNALSDDEVEQVARSRMVVDEVLVEISHRRDWMRKYPIIYALASNPRTPVRIAVRLVPQLAIRDLRNMSISRNVAEAVRARAQRLYQIKTR